MINYVVKTKDQVILKVIKQLDDRSAIGIKKYGTTLDDNNTDDFFQHLKEELMDAVNYVEKLQNDGLSAKKMLAVEGYYTDDMWTLGDVLHKYVCTKEEALDVLRHTVSNDDIVSEINERIDERCAELNFPLLND